MKRMTRSRISRVAGARPVRLLLVLGALIAALAFPASGWAVEEDITPPEVNELSVNPTEVNVTAESMTVTVTAKITDPPGPGGVSSGVEGGTIAYAAPGSTPGCFFSGNVCGNFVNKSGSEYTASVTFPKFGREGTWTPQVRVRDHAGNVQEYTSAQLEAAGFHVSVKVTSTPDTTPPEINSVTVGPPTAVTVSPPNGTQFVPVTATITDDLSGVRSAELEYSGPGHKHFAFASLQHATGNEWTGKLEFRSYQEAGTWSVAFVEASDNVGNTRVLTAEQLAALHLPTVQVTSEPVDLEPPKLVSLTASGETPCPEGIKGACVDAEKADQTVTLKAVITDNLSGTASSYFLDYVAPPGGLIEPAFAFLHKTSGNEFEGTVTIRRLSKAGFWKIGGFELYDNAGNVKSLSEAEIPEEAQIAVSRITKKPKVEPGESLSTGEGTSEINQIQSTLGIPLGGTGGEVELKITPRTESVPPGFYMLENELDITAPAQPDTSHPLKIEFSVDSSVFSSTLGLPPGCVSPGPGKPPPACTLTIFKNGVEVPTCTAVPPAPISPDPCIVSPQRQVGRETKVTIYSTTASKWTIGINLSQGTKAEPTTLATSLAGAGQSGEKISVPEGTAVTDTATLSGKNASKAGGKVSYKVYTDSKCAGSATEAGSVTVSAGKAPASEGETLAPGTYYWQASYGGDAANEKSSSICGSEVLTVEKSGTTKGTCGNTTVGKSSDALFENLKRVNRCTLPVNATVSELTVYLSPTSRSGSQSVRGIVYADSKGKPAGLVGSSKQLTFTSKTAASWYKLVFPAALKLAAGNYWIGIITGGRTEVAAEHYSKVAGAEDANSNNYTSGPSSSFGSFKTANEQMSLYAAWTASR